MSRSDEESDEEERYDYYERRPRRYARSPGFSRIRVFGWSLVVAVFLVGALSILGKFTSFGDYLGRFFGNETYSATGPVVLHKLQAMHELVVAEGTFEVPVVICNGKPKAYATREKADELLNACTGFRDEKATVLIRAKVQSVLDLSKVTQDDISVEGKNIEMRLPSPTLRRASVDAEDGVLIVGMKKSIWPGGLPDDYLAQAAKAAKRSVSKVAEQSGLREMGSNSAQEIFERLLGAFKEYENVTVTVDEPPKG
ncbi:MAG: DUF4230 domain-containing protein [Microthrixaceae bacterium]|nr:DUF4230 domain-containing protein [Microthrixaceae bacterium]